MGLTFNLQAEVPGDFAGFDTGLVPLAFRPATMSRSPNRFRRLPRGPLTAGEIDPSHHRALSSRRNCCRDSQVPAGGQDLVEAIAALAPFDCSRSADHKIRCCSLRT